MAVGSRTPQNAITAGMQGMSPILLGVLPFGMVAGAATVSLGVSEASAIGMSVLVFAGMAQLAIVDLLGKGAPLLVIIATALVVNLRFAIYSAALAMHLRGLTFRWSGPVAYLLSDQAYVISVSRFSELPEEMRKWFYLGAAFTLWFSWQVSFAFGAFVGTRVPPEWSLDFAVPLTLLALLPPSIRDNATRVTLVATSLAVCFLQNLPLELGTVASVVVGVGVGSLFHTRRES